LSCHSIKLVSCFACHTAFGRRPITVAAAGKWPSVAGTFAVAAPSQGSAGDTGTLVVEAAEGTAEEHSPKVVVATGTDTMVEHEVVLSTDFELPEDMQIATAISIELEARNQQAARCRKVEMVVDRLLQC
jgi:hypothetical protein